MMARDRDHMDFSHNFFAVLTLIAAPAVLTNASSVLALNTANRFGRVVDRSRALAVEIKGLAAGDELRELRVRQIGRLRQRAQLLIRAQSVIYAALGLFVMTALVSVIGSALALGYPGSYRATAVIGLVVGVAATGGLMHGCVLLVRETRLALVTLREDVALSEAPVEKK